MLLGEATFVLPPYFNELSFLKFQPPDFEPDILLILAMYPILFSQPKFSQPKHFIANYYKKNNDPINLEQGKWIKFTVNKITAP